MLARLAETNRTPLKEGPRALVDHLRNGCMRLFRFCEDEKFKFHINWVNDDLSFT